jgi:hypothetical protein
MGSALLSIALYFTFISAPALLSQVPDIKTPQTSESGEIDRLNRKITAQDAQLAAQQSQIDALQSGLAEQKAIIDKILQSHELSLVNYRPEEDALLLSTQVKALRDGQHAVMRPAVIRQEQPKAPPAGTGHSSEESAERAALCKKRGQEVV